MEGGRSDICADSIAEFYQPSEQAQNPMQSTAPPKMQIKVPANDQQVTGSLTQPPVVVGAADRLTPLDKLIHKDMAEQEMLNKQNIQNLAKQSISSNFGPNGKQTLRDIKAMFKNSGGTTKNKNFTPLVSNPNISFD